MGTKGARSDPASGATARRLVEELAEVGPVEAKKMFGGHGLFCDSVMFALVDPRGVAFLRAGDEGRKFEKAGGHRHGRMPYWSIPEAVQADHDTLVRWAAQALDVARAHRRPR